ncbi:glycoside hydrolase family 18 protein [Gregarina niphandrodes]|uniref:Glycoside hydrolase family 18 protein n=1 Tax=Gregarina niphandrodes TaxID=110365 RepID=A0A023AXT8_GRENI|nr:glycoside hydrolase family 18 protein [Gregarina niphandrodes]EZG43449.1 glycoside hydrolase family 18 protein [Gregarina niphandrodes]|eukprot:XP_011133321.1 glycoside hydrolase family 18 protein [Gregarina niphandrodes]
MRSLITASVLAASALAAERVPVYVYVDDWNYTGSALTDELYKLSELGVSAILLAFHLVGNPGFPENIADTVSAWAALSESERQAFVDKLHANGTKLMISSGGESEGLNWKAVDATTYGTDLCNLMKSLNVDGVDFDKEGFAKQLSLAARYGLRV